MQSASRIPRAVGCDTVSYPFGKLKKSVLKLMQIDILGLDQVLGQPVETHGRLKATADGFFLPLCGQKSGRYGNE